jgi:hypothetical protein
MTTPLEPASSSAPISPSAGALEAAGAWLRRFWLALRTPAGQRRLAWALVALHVLVVRNLVCQLSVAR